MSQQTQSQDKPQNQAPAKEPATKPAEKQKKAEGRRILRVSSRRDSFRRAGFSFTRAEQVLYVDELSNDQVAAIKAEPMLMVSEAVEE